MGQPRTNSRTVYLETFGCQMNELDSDLVRGQLTALGYRMVSESEAADVVLYNTCSVREQAENKVLSRLGLMGLQKTSGRSVVVGVIGCMAERVGPGLRRRFPQVDLMCGPGELDRLPSLLDNALGAGSMEDADRIRLGGSRSRRSGTLEAAADDLELLDLSRVFDPLSNQASGRPRHSAYVRITRGCNKFCTYCVVPYTRGAEVHRPPDAILDECRRLAGAGAIEITLLGQTVNHYCYTHGTSVTVDGLETAQVGPGGSAFRGGSPTSARKTTFAALLGRIHDEIPEILRLRFVTAYPRDFGDDILRVMAASPRICRYLHVPFQSGSNRILGLMNRGYGREEYLDFLARARSHMPDVCIAADVIVGFPTETEPDFEQTLDVIRLARFKNCFVFKYSPRPGTTAIGRLADDVEVEVKRRRNNAALATQAEIGAEVHAGFVGRTVEIFVEKVSRRSRRPGGGGVDLGWAPTGRVQLSGRTRGDLITVFDVDSEAEADSLMGRIVPVEVSGSGPLILRGRLGKEGSSRTSVQTGAEAN